MPTSSDWKTHVRARLKIVVAIAVIFGFVVGMMLGGLWMLKYAVGIGIKLLKEKKIDMELDAEKISEGILKYNHQFERFLNAS